MRHPSAQTVFAALTVFAGVGCARAAASSTTTGSAVMSIAVFETHSCRSSNGVIAVHNAETFALELSAVQLVAGGLGSMSGWPQRLGTLAPGRTDTLYDLRRDATHVEARPDSAHGQYNSAYRNGPPSVWPRNVEFNCVNASQTSR
jgi:hypothetical protein